MDTQQKKRQRLLFLCFLGLIISIYVSKGYSQDTTAHQMDSKVLKGEWIRPDGGYILNIKAVRQDIVDADYFNPKKIHIEQAGVSFWKGLLKLVIEFNDKGYKGSYYTLYYYQEKDALAGFYYQAEIDQSFEVVFIRKSEL